MRSVKYILGLAAVLLPIAVCAAPSNPADVNVGDSVEHVMAVLGEPQGFMKTEEYSVLYFERGKVEVRNGEVITAKLMSEAELSHHRARQALERELAQRRRLELVAEGITVRDEKAVDLDFLAQPASDRVTFWRRFQKKYPGVTPGEDYEKALLEFELELQERRVEAEKERRLVELEERVEVAEARADRAEEAANRSRSSGYLYAGPYSYTYVNSGRANDYYGVPRHGSGHTKYKKHKGYHKVDGYHGKHASRYRSPNVVRHTDGPYSAAIQRHRLYDSVWNDSRHSAHGPRLQVGSRITVAPYTSSAFNHGRSAGPLPTGRGGLY